MKVIHKLMGHAAPEMSMRYARLSPVTKRDAVRVLSSRCCRRARFLWPNPGPHGVRKKG